jgi:ABC-2 type transport system ATP-binding protein
MAKSVLKVSSISKEFSSVKAVKNLSFSVDEGDIYAFLGPNGAGKTTSLRMILDIIKPDAGQIEWNLNGTSSHAPSANHIGYLPEERGLYLDIPILKSLVYLATIRGMDKHEANKSALEWLERLGLANRAKEKLQVLSKGNQQKIQFVASILHKPRFAVLDEPFSGLDPLNQEIFIEFIKEINAQGTTILLSAHQMSLVEKIAHKVLLITNGQEVYNGSLSGIYQSFGNKIMISLELDSAYNDTTFTGLSHVELIENVDDRRVQITFGKDSTMRQVLQDLTRIDGIIDVTSHKPDLHEIYLQLVKNQ